MAQVAVLILLLLLINSSPKLCVFRGESRERKSKWMRYVWKDMFINKKDMPQINAE